MRHRTAAKSAAIWIGVQLSAVAAFAQPDWNAIKANAKPFIALPEEYGTPYRLDIAVGGWEDGLYITRDGLHLYCIYSPVDMFSFLYLGSGDISNFSAYRRGPSFGMDLTTNPIGAPEWLHGDILYTHRKSRQEPFPAWQLSNLARPVWSEGAVQIVMKNDSTADIFAYTSNHDAPPGRDDVDILIFRNSSLNPSGVGSFLPAPVNSDEKEDNPHFERLDSLHLVLFFDSDRPGGRGGLDIWYSTSSDDGKTWSGPQPVTQVNTELDDQMPHLFQDAQGRWWLYFMSDDPVTGKSGIYRSEAAVPGEWNRWKERQLVIGVGNTFAVGEPTLTRYGDISFVVVYDAGASATPTDRFDADPWFLPRKGSPTAVAEKEQQPPADFRLFQNFPNPFLSSTRIQYQIGRAGQVQLFLYNVTGQRVRRLAEGSQAAGLHSIVWNGRDDAGNRLPGGIYFLELRAGRQVRETRKVILLP